MAVSATLHTRYTRFLYRHSLTHISASMQAIKPRFTRFANFKVLFPAVSMVCMSKLKKLALISKLKFRRFNA